MAASFRRSRRSLIDRLRSDPQHFALLQAVRLAELAKPGAVAVGDGFDPRREAIRLRGSLSQSFPASDIAAWRDGADGQPPSVESAFLGLGGAFGPLPAPLSELARERLRHGDSGIRDFLDVFNHRLLSLFIRAKRAHRPALQGGRPEETGFADLLWALLGLATPGTRRAISRDERPRLSNQERTLLACTGLLNQRPVSAHAVERVLTHALDVPVTVVPFVGRWLMLDRNQTTVLGRGGRNTALGRTALLGAKVWDQTAAIRVEIHPQTLSRMLLLLPGSPQHGTLTALLAFALGGSVEVEARLTLPPAQVPGSVLTTRDPARQPRLGWTSWLTTRPRVGEGVVGLHLGRPGA